MFKKVNPDDSDTSVSESITPDPHAEPPWIELVESSQREADAERIHRCLARLDARTRRIVKERFGLNPGIERGQEKTQREVGSGLGVTYGRIQQLEGPALKKLSRLVALDIALSGHRSCEKYQRALVDEIRQRAIELSKTMDIIPGFIIRKLLADDGRHHSWEEIAEYLELPVEQIKREGEQAVATIQSFLIGEGKEEDLEDDDLNEPIIEVEDDRVTTESPEKERKYKKVERERSPLEIIMDSENGSADTRKQVRKAITRLLPFMPPLRYSIVTKLWGLNGEMVHSFEQIAASLSRKESVIISNFNSACRELQVQFEGESWWKSLNK